MIRKRTCNSFNALHRPATKHPFRKPLLPGVCAAVCSVLLVLMGGCVSSRENRNQVVPIPGETVPHQIRKGQPSEYDGWVVPTPLFNELAPCFKKVLESPEPGESEEEPEAPEPKTIPLPRSEAMKPASVAFQPKLFCRKPGP